ncbi:hypothetical protein OIU85_008713 [Salix viminalis]|uniref:Uncharacterized protein n=1 Tax=Salix viminalis TaxID=40686 RepID=A0A9Q0SIE3_SALVM|nr:hypothetical protein OIU85_008713 [Salix viminalis]
MLAFFGSGGSRKVDNSSDGRKGELVPTLKVQTDKDVYRPGDSILVTIEISNPKDGASEDVMSSLLIEKLGFAIRGIQKLDNQWFATQKPLPRSKQRRGEHVFMDCSTSSIVSNQIVSSGATKTYVVRTLLPSIIPPSYRGATIRYIYYVEGTLSGQQLMLDNTNSHRESSKDLIKMEVRIPLQIWVAQNSNGLIVEEGQSDGIVPPATIQLDIYWKEMDGDNEWARANDLDDGIEEGSLSLQSVARSSNKDASFTEGGRRSLSTLALPRLSAAEVLYDSGADMSVPDKSSVIAFPSQQLGDDMAGVSYTPGTVNNEPGASEGFIRGRSYNIRMDDHVLLRFSPRNSDSTYYFSDMIGGTLTFFHEEGAKKCLEVSITLETSETVSRRYIHPSRKNSPTITKVQSDHHEVVADLVQTSFLFSIPMDGPMSFSTAHVSVQWVLRFEFFTTPKNVDWTRFEHPLLIEGRDKSEWVLPITVRAPPPRAPAAHSRNEKGFSFEPLWVRT